MKPTVFLDFETRSRIDLLKSGATRYAQDPSTSIICLAWSVNDEDPELWVEGQRPPKRLMGLVKDGAKLRGWNAISFERNIWKYICVKRLGWQPAKLSQWYDTQHDAHALALPSKLDQCAEAVNAGEKKEKEGKRLIQFLSKPISSGLRKGEFRTRQEFPKDYASMYAYCKQDVRTERAIYNWMPRHIADGKERSYQLFTARINDRGAPIDVPAVEAIVEVIDAYAAEIKQKCKDLTGFGPKQNARMVEWFHSKGCEVPNLQGTTIAKFLKRDYQEDVKQALKYVQIAGRASTAKYKKILLQVCEDGRIHDNLIYHKAGTGRYAGAGVQLQNLPRIYVDDPEFVIWLFMTRDIDLIKLFGDPLKLASALLRPMVKAEVGKKLVDADLSKVEAIGTAYIAKEKELLKAFADGLDNYKMAAKGMFGIPYEEVDSEQRQTGKIAELSGGFGGGANAIVKGAEKAGLILSKERGEEIKKQFRAARKLLVRTWYAFGNASVQAVENPLSTSPVKTNTVFQFRYSGDFLYMSLPSGRLLSFPFPKVEYVYWKNKRPHLSPTEVPNSKKIVTAWWMDSKVHKWVKRAITGPNFFQSAVQGMCRDILMEAHIRIENDGWTQILSVHDEPVAEVPDTPDFSVERLCNLLKENPDWLPDMPINANGWEGPRYKKD